MEKPIQEGLIILGENNESLYISESYPMIITNRFESGDTVMQSISEKGFDTLVEASSATSGYPIDSKFLSAHNLASYPLHWNFDMVRGIWYETGVRLSEDGYTVSYPFFTLRNTSYFSDITP